MSGGSYDYLCFKDVDELFEREHTLERMADDLSKLGYANAAAQETLWILLELRAFKNRLSVVKDRLKDVWQAKEWWSSGDTGEEKFKEELTKYNNSLLNK
jgi:hypothetical protein